MRQASAQVAPDGGAGSARTRGLAPGVTLVVPVWNDAAGLTRLLAQARAMGCFAGIVVVDDGSDDPVPPAPDVTLIRHPRSRGSGAARNAGLEAVATRHVLFFDSDDLLTPELPMLLADLAGAGGGWDFCLFRHADTRVTAEGRWGQPDWDDALWAEAGHGCGALAPAAPAALPVLARTANYPWNKIYDTAFLHRNGIRCGQTRVHQDIPLHWLGFLAARRVLVSDRICAVHRVDPAGARLTNRTGATRLEVFEALAPVADAAARARDPAWRAAFAEFALGLTDWIAPRMGNEMLPRLRRAEADWLGRSILPWLDEIAARTPALAARLLARIEGAAAGAQAQASPAEGGHGGTLTFLCILREAGSALWQMAQDIADAARPGDQVVLVDDGSWNDTRAWAGRFGAMHTSGQGWGQGVQVDRIFAAPSCRRDTASAVNVGLDLAARDRVLVLTGLNRLDASALAAARRRAQAEDLDLIETPVAAPAPAPVSPSAALGGVIFRRALLDGADAPLRCTEGTGDDGAAAFLAALVRRAARTGRAEGFATRANPPLPGVSLFPDLAALMRQEPETAPWVIAALPGWLAGAGPGAAAALFASAADLVGALPEAVADAAPPPVAALLAALRAGDGDAARRWLRVLCTRQSEHQTGAGQGAPVTVPVPMPAPLPGGRPVRLCLVGRHGHRTPFSYPALAALWPDRIETVAAPREADLLVCAHPRDLAAMPPETASAAARTPFALISEEPFWDTLFSPDPLAAEVILPAGDAGFLRLHQVNHHRSAIFDFDRIPYFLLTDPGYVETYARLFARNAVLTADEWRADNAARAVRLAFMAERRPERFHDMGLEDGAVVGLCAWRTRLAGVCDRGRVERLGASWQGGPPRVEQPDWHSRKIALLDGRAQIVSAVENTHQPTYVSEKLFDAFACGSLPLYVAGPGHRVHDLGLPAGAWVNLWGRDSGAAAAHVDALEPEAMDWQDFARAQSRLAALFGDPAVVAAERERLRRAVLAEVARLVDAGAA